ncbi:MAG TPA: ATP-binding protein [Polyangiaceae bacterium]|jgi:signal transduction histidine kinase
MSISSKLAFGIIAGIVAILAVSSYFTVVREISLFETDMVRDHEVLERAALPALEQIWVADGPTRALELLTQVNTRRGTVSLRFLPREAISDEPPTEQLALSKLLLREGPRVVHVKREGHQPTLHTYSAVRVADQVPGVLELTESLEPRDAYVHSTVLRAAVTALSLGLVSAVLTFALGSTIVGRPVRALVDQVRRVGAGDLGARIDVETNDELAYLAREMNAMTGKLSEANKRLFEETAARVRALEQLRHADRLATVGKLASGIAHELGTPLNVVSGRAKMITQTLNADDTARQNARIVIEQSQRMAQIIRQLLDFARAGKPNKSSCDLRVLVASCLSLLKPIADKRGVTLELDADASIRPIVADSAQLQQVLTNLVVNAIQSMEQPGTVHVRLGAPPPGEARTGYLCLAVEDHGVGMSQATLERAFEPFFTTKDIGEGTGLGLAVAYGIVQEHGGFIDAISTPGQGSRFNVFLPLPAQSTNEST